MTSHSHHKKKLTPDQELPIADKLYDARAYRPEVLARLTELEDCIRPLQNRWDESLHSLFGRYGITNEGNKSERDRLLEIEALTLGAFSDEYDRSQPLLLGISGPGGAGKGTVRDQLAASLELNQVVNSTTRDQRDYETHGVHYFFTTSEELAANTRLTEESRVHLQQLLNLETTPEVVTGEMLDLVGLDIEQRIKDGAEQEGIDLVVEPGGQYLNLTYRPGRGWYGASRESLTQASSHPLSTFEESAPNLLRIGREIRDTVQYALVYVLPPQYIAYEMAARALNRDGVDQPIEKLLSTIGGRQVSEFEDFVVHLQDGDPTLILLVNDKVETLADGRLHTRTGQAFLDVLMS